jgi:uncharacterized protein (UPF0276 family)
VEGVKLPDWPHCLLDALDLSRSLNGLQRDGAQRRLELHVHFAHATSAAISEHELIRCEGFLRTTDTVFVNTHFRIPMDMAVDGKLQEDRLMSQALSHVGQLASKFGKNAIVVEHIPESEWLADLGCYPELVSQLVRTAGVWLLLDISHARLSARHYGCSAAQYIERLPLNRLKLIHSTGVGQDTDGSWVDHLPMDDHDYDLLAAILEESRNGRYPVPAAVQHEYGGITGFFQRYSSADVLEREVTALRKLCRDQ